jgi:hypothetical protein
MTKKLKTDDPFGQCQGLTPKVPDTNLRWLQVETQRKLQFPVVEEDLFFIEFDLLFQVGKQLRGILYFNAPDSIFGSVDLVFIVAEPQNLIG